VPDTTDVQTVEDSSDTGMQEPSYSAEEDAPAAENDDGVTEERKNGDASSLKAECEKSLDSLDTDYSKINWGVKYSPFKDLPGIVFSVAPALHDNSICLVVAVTNLYSEDVDVSGHGTAKGLNGEDISSFSLSAVAIGSGNTYIQAVDCGDTPSGEIRWENMEASPAKEKYVPWEADWTLTGKEDYTLNYSVIAEDTCKAGTIWALLLDSGHNIVGVYSTYDDGTDRVLQGNIQGIRDIDRLGVTDAAIFVNPLLAQ
jgi:hypothetical protein